MRNIKCVILSVVAVVLVGTVGACIAVNPFAAIGLAPVLAAIGWIIRAIGESSGPPPPHRPSDQMVTEGGTTSPHTGGVGVDCAEPGDRAPDHLG
jgi:hypothetical protein